MAFAVVAPTATAGTFGMKYFIGKLTGTWIGDVGGKASLTIAAAFAGHTSVTYGAYFVYIPPLSGYMFQWDISSITSNFSVLGGGASNAVLSSITYSVEFTSFNCVFNGIATAGIPFIAFGY